MSNGVISRDQNFIPVMGAVSSVTDSGASAKSLQYNTTNRGLTVHIVGEEIGFVTTLTDGSQVTKLYDSGGGVVNPASADLQASTETILTGGTQKSQIVDAGGDAVTVTGGKLDVNATVDTTGLATSAKQDTIIGHVDGVETLLGTIDADTSVLAAAVTSNKVQVDVISMPAGGSGLTDTELRATPVPVSGTFYQATQPVSIATAPVLVAGTALIGKVSIDQVTANANEVVTKTGSVTAATLSAETTKVIGTINIAAAQTLATVTTVGAVTAITNALPAGTNAIGKLAANSGVDIGDVDVTSIAAGTNNIGQVSVAPQTANGLSVFNGTSSDGGTALTSTAQVIKASAGQVYGWYIYNPNSTAQFVQFYNTAAASVTVGTTSPLFMLTIPATAGANVEFTNGITFSNAGFSCAATSTAGGNGAPTTALDAVVFFK